ncbi:lysosomal beta glucosidase-like [Olea europaea var. sylvestris]|uniref:lysosomal beta glucosidase-like n=1 Tax=Olea europaea var. sylvestris TaxID=158386 RepID=UPI000C1D1FEB|nr:lysosomal beta glucosidase-like [Olea europaea var. sylvestris]
MKTDNMMFGRVWIVWVGIMVLWWGCRRTMGEEYMVYKDAKQPIGVRVKDLLSRMTLEEKIGQMAQIDRVAATADIMKKHYLGSIISGGGSAPLPHATAADWVKMVNDFQKGSLSTRLAIPMIYGIDAVHGNNNIYNATIFPHNIGLGATSKRIGVGLWT